MTAEVVLPCYHELVFEKLNYMRQNSILTDVVLICGDKKFEAHRSHLSAASEYLYKMFNSGLKESVEPTVEFPTLDHHSLEVILNILYTGKLSPLEFNTLKSTLMAAHMMQLQDVFSHYRRLFISELGTDNFMELWELGETLEDQTILNAVYNIVDQIYQLQEFQTIEVSWLRKLLEHLSLNGSSQDFLFKVITQWINGAPQNRFGHFEELMEFIDLQKSSNTLLAKFIQDPLVMQSECFKNKCLDLTTKRFLFMVSVFQETMDIPPILLLGDNGGKCILQKCYLGEWDNNIVLEGTESDNASLVVHKSEFYLVTKENVNDESEANFIIFDREGHKESSKTLAIITTDTKLVAAEHKNMTIVVAYSEVTQDDFFICNEGKISMRHYDFMRNIKLQLLATSDNLFLITEDWASDGQVSLSIYMYMYQISIEDYEWYQMKAVDWTEKSSNWFAYYFPPHHIVLRTFPGDSVYYDIDCKEFEVRLENNTLPDVVSLEVWRSRIWCLTKDGSLYMQEASEGYCEWRLIIKPPFPLQKYTQILIDKT